MLPLVDDRLPGIDLALDVAEVTRRFSTRWPGLGPEPVEILRCTRRDTKYEPGARCVVAYELDVRGPDGARRSCFGVVEITPAGMRHRLATGDPALPGVASLRDPEAVAARCAELFGPITHCEVTPVRYKPGARCVLRIDLFGLERPKTSHALFAKVFRTGAREQAETLAALAALDDPGLPGFAMPLALWADWEAIVQHEVEGTPLHALLRGPDHARAFHDCGRRVAGLHAAAVPGPGRGLAEDLAELAGYTAVIAQADPALAERFTALTERLGDVEDAEAELVASHGALRTDAFMLPASGAAPVLMDLDGFCWADPARDLANLVAYLDWRAIRYPRDQGSLRLLANAFLQGYADVRALPHPWRLGHYRAASLLKIAGRRYRGLTFAEWPLVPHLMDQATRLLGREPRG